MSATAIDSFEAMIRSAGEGWLIDYYAPRENALPELRERLRRANDAARQRLGGNAPQFTPEMLVKTYGKNPHKVRAFLQVISRASPDMLVMVWRIIQGMTIAAISIEYDAGGAFRLKVRLSSPYEGGTDEEYASSDIDDAVILRHLGTMKMGTQGIFDGFYALNLGAK